MDICMTIPFYRIAWGDKFVNPFILIVACMSDDPGSDASDACMSCGEAKCIHIVI